MYIMGFNLSHDCSACLIKDGEIKVAIALERITRIKRGIVDSNKLGRGINELITYCIQAEGISFNDISYFIANTTETINENDERNLLMNFGFVPKEKILAMPHPSHHLSHASAAFYTSGFKEAAVLVVDCYGSMMEANRESESGFVFSHQTSPEFVFRNIKNGHRIAGMLDNEQFIIPRRLQGVGEIYRIITMLLGFVQNGTYYDDAGKTMGLAPYGKLISETPIFMQVSNGEINYSNAFNFLAAHNLITKKNEKYYLNIRDTSAPLSQFHMDLAAQVQYELEEVCLYMAKKLRRETNQKNLVLSGGTFLNSVANYRILNEAGFDDLYILPPATDDGNAIGVALYAYHHIVDRQTQFKTDCATKHFYLGNVYKNEEILDAINLYKADFQELKDFDSVAEFTAKVLADGNIVGWYQDGSEFGPRALGHRSILANPAVRNIKDVLNERVKFREGFRPFAPVVISEKADLYFEIGKHKSPYMLLVCPVREEFRSIIPGITHVDHTARLQTLARDTNPLLYQVIQHFETYTDIAVLLNTSFNLKGMPIVEHPLDALECFYATNMDYLIMGKFVVSAPRFDKFIPVRRDLSVIHKGIWYSKDIDFTTETVQIIVDCNKKIILDSTKKFSFTADEWEIIKLCNGAMTVEDIADKFNMQCKILIEFFLKRHREGLIYWQHLEHLYE